MRNMNIQSGTSSYDIVYGEYENTGYGTPMCCFIWLKNGRAGPSFAWPKGSHLFASYVLEKTDMNIADLSGILYGIKIRCLESIGEMMYFDEDYMYKGTCVMKLKI